MTPAEHLAKLFHETYEALAPQYGYETRKETAVPWEALPESNRLLMIATCNAILEDEAMPRARIAQLEAQVEAAHRAIDSIGLSRCADAHAGVYPDGRITCDDGRPPLSLVDRTKWLITWMTDEPYPLGKRIAELEKALGAAQDDAARANERAEKWKAAALALDAAAWKAMYWDEGTRVYNASIEVEALNLQEAARPAALAQTGEVKV